MRVHSAALLQQLLDAAQRLQEHLASAAEDLPCRLAPGGRISIAQACELPVAAQVGAAAHQPQLEPASRQTSLDPASASGGASAQPVAPPGRPEGLGAALPQGIEAPSAPLSTQLCPCEQQLEARLPEAAKPTGAQGEKLAEQAAATGHPSSAPGAGLAQMLVGIAAGLDLETGVVAEVSAILAADAAARAGRHTVGPSPAAHRRSCAPRRSTASARDAADVGCVPRGLEQPAWGRSAECADRQRRGAARWRTRHGGSLGPGAGGDPVSEALTHGGARMRAMLPATEWSRVRRPRCCAALSSAMRFVKEHRTRDSYASQHTKRCPVGPKSSAVAQVEATPDGYHRTPWGDLQVPPQSPAAAAAAHAHFAFDGSGASGRVLARGEFSSFHIPHFPIS